MKSLNKQLYLLIVLMLCFSLRIIAQENPLNRRINLNASGEQLLAVLDRIEDENQVYFSYNPNTFDQDKKIDVRVQDEKLNKVLENILPKGMRLKAVNEHVIILPPQETKPKKTKKSYQFSGLVTDASDGKPLSDVSVLLPEINVSTLTDADGRFSLISKKDALPLLFSKRGYKDSLIYPKEQDFQHLEIALWPKFPQAQNLSNISMDSIGGYSQRPVAKMLVPREAVLTAENVKTYTKKPVQVSLLPFLGSNYKMSGTRTNNLSINIIAGYAGGLNGTEIAGFANVISGDINGWQFAGFSNVVGGKGKGWQTSGFFNYMGGSLDGVQFSGWGNVLMDTLSGMQISGFVNTLKGGMSGVQLAGFANITTKNVDGAQISGFANWAHGDVRMLQLSGFGNYARGDVNMAQVSGFANVSDNLKGAQITGFGNIALGKSKGVQIAGFMNYSREADGVGIAGFTNLSAGTSKGVQIAGFLNVAKNLRGVQIGIVNVVDSVESGVPIGLLNFVWHGYHKLDISANDVFPLNISYKGGVPAFYSIISFGSDMKRFMQAGAGFGSVILQGKHWGFSSDLSWHVVLDKEKEELSGNLMLFQPTLIFRMFQGTEIYAGPQLRYLITEDNKADARAHFGGMELLNKQNGNTWHQLYLGATVGLRAF